MKTNIDNWSRST